MLKLNYIVTGTGRCGTTFYARLLTSLEIPCVHEGIFNYKGLDWAKLVISGKGSIEPSHCSTHDVLSNRRLEPWLNTKDVKAESSYMAAPFLGDDILEEVKIIHVIRNPLDVISSHVVDANFFGVKPEDNPWLKFVFNHMPELKNIENKIERACYYYVHWNMMIEKIKEIRPYLLHKAEDMCDEKLIKFLNVKKPEIFFEDNKINSWKKGDRRLRLEDIPNGKIKNDFIEITERYNYKIKNKKIFT